MTLLWPKQVNGVNAGHIISLTNFTPREWKNISFLCFFKMTYEKYVTSATNYLDLMIFENTFLKQEKMHFDRYYVFF